MFFIFVIFSFIFDVSFSGVKVVAIKEEIEVAEVVVAVAAVEGVAGTVTGFVLIQGTTFLL